MSYRSDLLEAICHTSLTSNYFVLNFDFIFNQCIVSTFFFWETDLQKSIDFLLNPFFVFRNDLYVNLLYYMYTCCYTKMK